MKTKILNKLLLSAAIVATGVACTTDKQDDKTVCSDEKQDQKVLVVPVKEAPLAADSIKQEGQFGIIQNALYNEVAAAEMRIRNKYADNPLKLFSELEKSRKEIEQKYIEYFPFLNKDFIPEQYKNICELVPTGSFIRLVNERLGRYSLYTPEYGGDAVVVRDSVDGKYYAGAAAQFASSQILPFGHGYEIVFRKKAKKDIPVGLNEKQKALIKKYQNER